MKVESGQVEKIDGSSTADAIKWQELSGSPSETVVEPDLNIIKFEDEDDEASASPQAMDFCETSEEMDTDCKGSGKLVRCDSVNGSLLISIPFYSPLKVVVVKVKVQMKIGPAK